MSAEVNKAIVDSFNVELNKGNLGFVDAYFAPDFIGHSPLFRSHYPQPRGIKAFLTMMSTAMPDLHYPSWTLITEGDLVAIRMSAEGTFTNPLMGIPPNGEKAVVWIINIWRFADGKIVEWWCSMDTLGFIQLLGAIPPLGG